MSSEEQLWARENTFVCLVHDEYNANSRVVDFLVRNSAAIDPKTGTVAIAALLRVGYNLQFQIRDAYCASFNFAQKK